VAGRAHDFERAGDAGGVGGVKRGGALGVFAGERGMGKVHQGADGGANVGVYGRDGGDPVEQGADIEAGSAHEDGQGALFVGLFDFGAGGLCPVGGGTGCGAVPGAEQAVGHALHLGLARAGAQDGKVGIDLRAVGIDHHGLAAPRLLRQRETDGKIALAAGGRPCNERQRPVLVGPCEGQVGM
jgi:hypothetical protein